MAAKIVVIIVIMGVVLQWCRCLAVVLLSCSGVVVLQFDWRDQAVETDMGTVRDVVGQCLSLRKDFNLTKAKANGERQERLYNYLYKYLHKYLHRYIQHRICNCQLKILLVHLYILVCA